MTTAKRPGEYATYAAYCSAAARRGESPISRYDWSCDRIGCTPPAHSRREIDRAARDGKPYIGY